MSMEELKAVLDSVGIPVAYRAFRKPQKPPYICYLEVNSKNFAADGIVYFAARQMQIELYTANRDQELEDRVEAALSSFYWGKSENYIDSEKCYQITYEIEV